MERPIEPPDEAPSEGPPGTEPEPQGEPDFLTIGLLVFFVSLILVVGALLVLPAIF